MTTGKNWYEEENDEFHNTFKNEEGDLKVQVTESRIAYMKTLSPPTKILAVHPCYIPFTQTLFSQSHYIYTPSTIKFTNDLLQQEHNTMI